MCNVPLTLRWYSLAYSARRYRSLMASFAPVTHARDLRGACQAPGRRVSCALVNLFRVFFPGPGILSLSNVENRRSSENVSSNGRARARRWESRELFYHKTRMSPAMSQLYTPQRPFACRRRCIRNTIVRVPRRGSIRGWSISLSRTVRTGSQARKYTVPRLAQVKISSSARPFVPLQPVYHFPQHFQLISHSASRDDHQDIPLHSFFILHSFLF